MEERTTGRGKSLDEKLCDVYTLSSAVFFLWCNSLAREQVASLLRSLDHTQLDTQPAGLL